MCVREGEKSLLIVFVVLNVLINDLLCVDSVVIRIHVGPIKSERELWVRLSDPGSSGSCPHAGILPNTNPVKVGG